MLDGLLRYMHHPGSRGQSVREAVIMACQLSVSHPELSQYLSNATTFGVEVAGGLSAAFSNLPMMLPAKSKKSGLRAWAYTPEQLSQRVPQLQAYFDALDFCGQVVTCVPSALRVHILEQTYQGFLRNVMLPALHQRRPSEVVAAVTYFRVSLSRVSSRPLLGAFLRLLLQTEGDDGVSTLDRLVRRVDSLGEPCMAALCLIQALLDLRCEDVMQRLCLTYLTTGRLEAATTSSSDWLSVAVDSGCTSVQGDADKASSDGAQSATLPSSSGSLFQREACLSMAAGQHFLSLLPTMTAASPFGLDFEAYLLDAAVEMDVTAAACADWRLVYLEVTAPDKDDGLDLLARQGNDVFADNTSDGTATTGVSNCSSQVRSRAATLKPSNSDFGMATNEGVTTLCESQGLFLHVLESMLSRMMEHPLAVRLSAGVSRCQPVPLCCCH